MRKEADSTTIGWRSILQLWSVAMALDSVSPFWILLQNGRRRRRLIRNINFHFQIYRRKSLSQIPLNPPFNIIHPTHPPR
jgi:hypothetical protein